jgi:hypothetical protein
MRVLGIMGTNARLYCQPYQLDDASDTLPSGVLQPYRGQGIWDVHNFLEIDTAGQPLKIDLTWSRELADFGFPTTLAWDGASDFRIAAPSGQQALRVIFPLSLMNKRKRCCCA